jgi:eukaryotic-like serine/threonine-protein kinase
MKENGSAEDSPLLSIAESICDGTPVNWSEVHESVANGEQTAVMAELRLLEDLSRITEPLPLTWGPFAISDEIGRGSFGTVYRAFDANLDLEVALKVIRRVPGAPIDAARALTEARLLAQINHPNVVRVYRAERIGNEFGLAMELVTGESLAEIVRRHGPFSASEAMLVGVDVCHALAAVHGVNVLHGDIKAHNVMRADGGRTVLMDFGAGKDLKTEAVNIRGNVMGTPLYLAPEVLAGGRRTKASDVYSLGVLLYYLVSGSYPVQGTTRTEIKRGQAHGTPRRPLRDIRPDLPDAFIQIVDRALAERPYQRHQTAGELEADLRNALRLTKREVSPAVSWRKWLIAASLVLALGLSATLAFRMLFRQAADTDGAVPGAQRADTTRREGSGAPPVAAASPDEYRIEAAMYRDRNGASARLQSGARLAPGDKLSLQVWASVPVHVYIVNEDEQGESYLLFPLPGQSMSNPLAALEHHRLPGGLNREETSWQVTTAGGREHFLIFATPAPPSPAFERMFAALPRPAEGRPVRHHRLSRDAINVLRGVGGLSTTVTSKQRPLRLDPEFAAPLTATQEVARGVWVRQLTLENPVK